jgi:SP family xylose:H+ symportor-like MFS transporter
MIAGGIFAVSSLAMAVANGVSFFIAACFTAGIGVGMASMLSPLYIAEVAPAPVPGRMVSIYQLAIIPGILFTNVENYFLRENGASAWRWMSGLGIIPSVLFCARAYFVPESLRWLIQKNKMDKAKRVLATSGNLDFAIKTFNAINKSLDSKPNEIHWGLFKKPFGAAILIGIGLTIFQQFGINVVFNYTTTIFQSIGFSKGDQLLQTVFIGGVNLAFTLLAMSLVDKLGCKPLILIGAGGLAILYIFIAQALQSKSPFTAGYLLAAIDLYATSLAPVTWILIREIFPNSMRATATNRDCMLMGSLLPSDIYFPILAKLMGGIAYTFYIYSIICAVGVFFWSLK